ncbi:MAG: NTP transferase domain-containing protein, partial [Flavobacteriaceae bacterium]
MTNIPHLLLAAGTSKRMGEPKQLLKWGSKSLIQHQVEL